MLLLRATSSTLPPRCSSHATQRHPAVEMGEDSYISGHSRWPVEERRPRRPELVDRRSFPVNEFAHTDGVAEPNDEEAEPGKGQKGRVGRPPRVVAASAG